MVRDDRLVNIRLKIDLTFELAVLDVLVDVNIFQCDSRLKAFWPFIYYACAEKEMAMALQYFPFKI